MKALGGPSIINANNDGARSISYAKAGSERIMPARGGLPLGVKVLARRGDGITFRAVPGRAAGFGIAHGYSLAIAKI
jgi:hypothetical protein